MRHLFILFISVVYCVTVLGQHTNVMISNINNPNEPAIVLNPSNPEIMLAASNLNNYFTSKDGGKSWNIFKLRSSLGVWGDPALAVDTAGNFYFFHLSNPEEGNWIDRIVCQKSNDNGQTWSNGTYTGLNGLKVQDKEWPVINRKNNHIYVSWTQFDKYGSEDPLDSSLILFSKSIDGAQSWSDPLRINKWAGDCIDDDNTVEGAVPAIGPDGEIYVSWLGPKGLVFNRSLDEGESWMDEEFELTDVPGGWAFSVPGIYRCNGLPITLCDTSGGGNNGTIYINWSDQRNGTNDTDIWLLRSTDGGDTWSEPIRVNDDQTDKHQFFTWMAIDQTNGYLYFVFYDRRNYSDIQTDVYMAVSKDGGETFDNFKISDSPFIPDANIFFGDYTNIVAHDNIVRPIWIRLHGGQLSVWTALVDVHLELNNNGDIQFLKTNKLEQNYPNPVKDITHITFKLHEPTNLSIELYNVLGKKVCILINNKTYPIGKHKLQFVPQDYQLDSGFYYYVLKTNKQIVNRKMLIVK